MSYISPTERRERFRAILAGDQCVFPAPVFDPISARIAEDLGFELGFLSGPGAQRTVLGAPNHHVVVLTLSELAEQARRICRASNISLLVSAENGYGNSLNVMRTVEELENAGVSALTIEDTALPMCFGNARGVGVAQSLGEESLISLEEGVGKMKAALAARQDPSLVILARTKALNIEGIPEAIRRIKAYERTGVDGIFLAWAKTREEVAAIHAETRLPLILGRAGEDLADKRLLAANGVRIALQGHHLGFWASVKAVYDTLKALRDGASPADLRPTLASPELLAQVTRQSQYNEWIKDFLH